MQKVILVKNIVTATAMIDSVGPDMKPSIVAVAPTISALPPDTIWRSI
jgi:hypothetical protein